MNAFVKTETKTFTLNKGDNLGVLTLETLTGGTEIRLRLSRRGQQPLWIDLTQDELRELRDKVLFDLWVLPTHPLVQAHSLDTNLSTMEVDVG